MENVDDADFEWFLKNSNSNNPATLSSIPPPPTPNHQSSRRNFLMPENHANGSLSLPANQVNGGLSLPANYLRQENHTSIYDLETGFSGLNLSSSHQSPFLANRSPFLAPSPNHSPFLPPSANHSPFLPPSPNHSSFLAPSADALNGGLIDSMFDSALFSRQISNADLERLRVQSALRGQIGLYGQTLDGFGTLSSNYFNDFDHYDHIFNDGGRGTNLANPQAMIRSRNGLQFQSPYQFNNPNRNGFMLENPTQTMGRFTHNNEYTNPSMSSFYNTNGTRLRHKFLVTASLEEMRGKVLSLATDQNGCRILQRKFEERKPEDIDLIFSEVKDYIRQLMIHQFGNYLIQKFFDVCDQAKITQMLASVISHEQAFVKICLDIHGTRAMQKLLEQLTTPEQRASVVSVLERVNVTVPLIKSGHGHHVIQHCIKFFPSEEIATILHVVADYCVPIATNQSGCCVIQHCVQRAAREEQERLVAEITANAVLLAQDPYGNYVVQFVIDTAIPQYRANILAGLAGSFVSLSMDKYGSNVVEKCIKECNEEQSAEVIKEIVYSPNFLMVIQNAYGNYVAQSALLCSKGRLHDKVSDLIQNYHPFLHSHPHGKRALARTRGGSKQHAMSRHMYNM